MISYAEAYKTVIGSAIRTETEIVPFKMSEGRILAEDVYSDADMPPFNRSAVDGYACRLADLKSDMEVVEVIAAGMVPTLEPGPGQCSKIMTGAIVPDGCDLVFMVEDAVVQPGGKVRFTGRDSKQNISFRGEDVKSGDKVLATGKKIKPQDIAVLASCGKVEIKASKKPRIAVISTGDEIIEPDRMPGRSQIRNSNAYQLMAQANASGGDPHYYGVAPDTGDRAFEIITDAISNNDIIILTGGVSMGDFDIIPAILSKAGIRILFNRINVQPGKPTTFGSGRGCLVFGLPGNPVSAFIQFETLVKPLIAAMTGDDSVQRTFMLPMGVRYERNSASRMGWIPVSLNKDNEVIPAEYHGSAHITSLSYSDGIITIMPEVKILEKGAVVEYRPF